MRRRNKPRLVTCLDDLPPVLAQQVSAAGISSQEAEAHLDSLLNALHIRTKERFYTKDGLQSIRDTRGKYNRRNTGPSTISQDIVSTAALDAEHKALLCIFRESDYTFIKKLGKGGFGHVFLAEEKKTLEKVAIKKMPHATEKQRRKNFQEVRFLQYCTRNGAPGIVEFRRAAIIDNEMWLLTEQIDGGTLTQAIARSPKFSEAELAYIACELLRGLKFLHDNLIAHRDMKSGNIVLGKDGAVKIIDFGLCSDISGGEIVHRVGSPFWLPPEMINHEPHGLPVDVWSFGICCMEIVNSHPPHQRSALRAMFVAATEGYPDPVEDKSLWSDSVRDFVGRSVIKDPKQRWTVDQLLLHDFIEKRTDKQSMSALFTKIF